MISCLVWYVCDLMLSFSIHRDVSSRCLSAIDSCYIFFSEACKFIREKKEKVFST